MYPIEEGSHVRHPGLGILEVSHLEASGRRLWARDAHGKQYQMSIESVVSVHESIPLSNSKGPRPEPDKDAAQNGDGASVPKKAPAGTRITVTCSLEECQKTRELPPSQYAANRTGRFYCTREHAIEGRRRRWGPPNPSGFNQYTHNPEDDSIPPMEPAAPLQGSDPTIEALEGLHIRLQVELDLLADTCGQLESLLEAVGTTIQVLKSGKYEDPKS